MAADPDDPGLAHTRFPIHVLMPVDQESRLRPPHVGGESIEAHMHIVVPIVDSLGRIVGEEHVHRVKRGESLSSIAGQDGGATESRRRYRTPSVLSRLRIKLLDVRHGPIAAAQWHCEADGSRAEAPGPDGRGWSNRRLRLRRRTSPATPRGRVPRLDCAT